MSFPGRFSIETGQSVVSLAHFNLHLLASCRIPALLLGLILLAYWGRVLRMAHKARRRTGRAANLIPAERVGRAVRLVWTPVVIVWVAHPFVTALVEPLPAAVRPVVFAPWIAWPMVLVAGACLAASRLCWRAMGRDWRMGIDPGEQNPLISCGPFAWCRHPIYGLSALLMLASVAIIPSPIFLAAGVVHLTLLFWESQREERHLLSVHGARYAEYQKRVGRFLPGVRRSE